MACLIDIRKKIKNATFNAIGNGYLPISGNTENTIKLARMRIIGLKIATQRG